MTTQVHPASFDFEARETLRVEILSLYYAKKAAAATERLPFDTKEDFDSIVVKVAGLEHRADMKAYISMRRRKPKKGKPPAEEYPYPDEDGIMMINRLANLVGLRLSQLRRIEGAPLTNRNRDARFFGVVGAVLKYERWRNATYDQVRQALLEELRRRAQQARSWKQSTKREPGAPTLPYNTPTVPF